jgi:hypothetical protein
VVAGKLTGGDPKEDLDLIVDGMRSLGPDFEEVARTVEQNPDVFVFWAFDSVVDGSGFLSNVNITTERVPSAMTLDTYMDTAVGQLPPQFRVVKQDRVSLDLYEAGRLEVEISVSGQKAKQLMYVFKEGKFVWLVIYSSSKGWFEAFRPTFEQSIGTFRIRR